MNWLVSAFYINCKRVNVIRPAMGEDDNDENNDERKFYKIIDSQLQKSNRKNFTTDKINKYIDICRKRNPKSANDYYVLQNFDIWTDKMGNYFLIKRKLPDKKGAINDNDGDGDIGPVTNSPPPIFITIERIYQFIKKAHERHFHPGIKKTFVEVRKMVENIKINHVKTYLSLCYYCTYVKNKNQRDKNTLLGLGKKSIISHSFNSRAQVDLIDIRCLKMKEWRYVLNYQDNLTKFCHLKPLTDKKNSLVISSLAEIFNLFGAPKILQSDNGGEFRGKEFVNYFRRFWPDVRLIRSSPYHPQSQGSVERANGQIKRMIMACVHHGVFNYNFPEILSYIQYVKNTSYHRIIKCTPYKAMFGQDVVVEQNIENIFENEDNNNDDCEGNDRSKDQDWSEEDFHNNSIKNNVLSDDDTNYEEDLPKRNLHVTSQRKNVLDNLKKKKPTLL